MASQIDHNVEERARVLLGSVVEDEHEELERTLESLTQDEPLLLRVMTLVGRVATLAVVQRCEDQRPTTEDLALIGAATFDSYTGSLPLAQEDVRAFLGGVLFDGDAFDAVLGPEKSVLVPLIVTATLLESSTEFEPWHRYLDVLEAGLEQSDGTSMIASQDPEQT